MRRLPSALSLSLLIALATGAAHAEGVTTTLHGSVVATSGDAVAQLAALGVQKDAQVTVSYTIESTTPKGDSSSPEYAIYPEAITDLSLTIGQWTAVQDVPALLALLNFVQVGDSKTAGLGDTYLLSTLGTDTDLVLTGPTPEARMAFLLVFAHDDHKLIDDDGVIQDADKFLVGTCAVAGANGSISMKLDTHPGGGGGGGGSIGPGLARKGQLKAASKFGGSLFKIFGKSASKPTSFDPFGAKESAAVDAAEEKFAKDFIQAVNKALKKGGTAPLPSSSQGLAQDNIEGNIDPLKEALLTGANPDDKNDRALRGKLFKAAAAQCSADLSAYSKNAMKPSAAKLSDKLAKAKDKLLGKVDKAIAAAAKKGIEYTGPTGAEISDVVEALAEEFDLLTQGIQPAVAAANEHAQAVAGVGLALEF